MSTMSLSLYLVAVHDGALDEYRASSSRRRTGRPEVLDAGKGAQPVRRQA